MSRFTFLFIAAAVATRCCYPQQGGANITVLSVVNSASFERGLPSGGALATIFCYGLDASKGTGTFLAPASGPLPYELAGVSVYVNNGLAPILAVIIPASTALQQINFQVPMERNATDTGADLQTTSVVIEQYQLFGSGTLTLYGLPQQGGFFSDANGYAIAQHASDFTPVTVQNPAHAGETVIAYADDFFKVWPPPPMGVPAPAQPLSSVLPHSVYIGSGGYTNLYLESYPVGGGPFGGRPKNPLQVQFAGSAPGLVGVEQINFVVPAGQAPGDWPLFYAFVSTTVAASPYVKLPVR